MLIDEIGVILTAIFSGIAAFAALRASIKTSKTAHHVEEIHVQINSRMDELVRTTKALGHSEGLAEGLVQP